MVYALLLGASHLWMLSHPPVERGPAVPGPERLVAEISPQGEAGPVAPGQPPAGAQLSILHFGPAEDPRPPVLCLHGSPGSARNFEDLGQQLGARGRRVLALDLPGFGRSTGAVPSYSILAHARSALAALDALGIERVHIVAWSMGGGVALHMADLAPQRVASLSLIASLGVQEAEGSGSYAFEHLKYAALAVALGGLPELLPHFGALGHYGRGSSFVRNFWDTDQRPLTAIMAGLETSTLILHGRDDFLVPVWAAERSHELIGPSRFELADAGHFLPLGGEYGQLDWTLERLEPFLERREASAAAEPRARVSDAPPRRGAERFGLEPFTLTRVVPWWVHLLVLVAAAMCAPLSAALAAGALAAGLQLDFGLALIACLAGAGLRPGPRGPLRALGRVLLAFVLALIAGSLAAGWLFPPAAQWLALVLVAGALLLGRRRGPSVDASPPG